MSIGRVAIGLGLVATPRIATGLWLGPAVRSPAKVLARALGARDLAIGAGALAALGGEGSLRPWLLAGLLADVTDFAATLADRDGLPGTAVPVVAAAAGAGVALGAIALAGESGGHSAPVPA
jgi:hypothetical protein